MRDLELAQNTHNAWLRQRTLCTEEVMSLPLTRLAAVNARKRCWQLAIVESLPENMHLSSHVYRYGMRLSEVRLLSQMDGWLDIFKYFLWHPSSRWLVGLKLIVSSRSVCFEVGVGGEIFVSTNIGFRDFRWGWTFEDTHSTRNPCWSCHRHCHRRGVLSPTLDRFPTDHDVHNC